MRSLLLTLCLALPALCQEPAIAPPADRKMGIAKPLALTPEFETYGRELKAAPVVTLADALRRPAAYAGATIEIRGQIDEVCLVKGCWMMVGDGERSLRVHFKDYSFFMPLDVAGRHATLEGQLEVKVQTEAERRHYAEDAGKSKDEIEAIKGDEVVTSFLAEAVRIGTPRPHEPNAGLAKSLGVTAAGATIYGRLPAPRPEIASLAAVLANPKAFEGRDIAIEGFAEEICTIKGCWMILRHGKDQIRVKFKDYLFFMPIDGTGRWAHAQGRVEVKVESEELRRHYAEDAGKSREEIEAIKGDLTVVSFMASAVTLGVPGR